MLTFFLGYSRKCHNISEKKFVHEKVWKSSGMPKNLSFMIIFSSKNAEMFDFFFKIYTNEGHYMKGALLHLYKTIDWFLDESFGPTDQNEWEPTGFFAFKQ